MLQRRVGAVRRLLVAVLAGLLAIPVGAAPPRAVLIGLPSSEAVSLYYTNLYSSNKQRVVSAKWACSIEFDENSYSPVLVEFSALAAFKQHERAKISQRPALLLLPGDTVTVQHNRALNTFTFKGRHQAELDFCWHMWQGKLHLAGFYTELGEAAGFDPTTTYLGSGLINRRHQPLSQYLRAWDELRQEGEARMAELRRTAGIRPEVAASLTRHIQLRLFQLLLAPTRPWNRRDSLRLVPPAYRDTVAAQANRLVALQQLPARTAEGLGGALNAYTAYQCGQAGHFPTVGTRYTQAKQSLSGFYRALVCYQILDQGQRLRQDIRRWLLDYSKWVAPYGEFVQVLRGAATVPLRSYPPVVFSDSLTAPTGQRRHLTDLLAAYRGQVLLLDLWASWCQPCREEMPQSVALASRYGSRGLAVLYLSIDQDPAAWRQALRQLPASVRPQWRFRQPDASVFLREFEVRTVPRYVLIDRSGAVRYPEALRPGDPRLGAVLEKLLQGK